MLLMVMSMRAMILSMARGWNMSMVMTRGLDVDPDLCVVRAVVDAVRRLEHGLPARSQCVLRWYSSAATSPSSSTSPVHLILFMFILLIRILILVLICTFILLILILLRLLLTATPD
eukprot:3961001-Pyramimonas_sp.AAC.2